MLPTRRRSSVDAADTPSKTGRKAWPFARLFAAPRLPRARLPAADCTLFSNNRPSGHMEGLLHHTLPLLHALHHHACLPTTCSGLLPPATCAQRARMPHHTAAPVPTAHCRTLHTPRIRRCITPHTTCTIGYAAANACIYTRAVHAAAAATCPLQCARRRTAPHIPARFTHRARTVLTTATLRCHALLRVACLHTCHIFFFFFSARIL